MDEGEFKMRVLEDLATIKQIARQTDRDILTLKKTIYGNGTMGLKTQVVILWGCFVIVGGLALKVLVR